MNVKELGYEADLIALQKSGDLGGKSFYFDFELLESKSPGHAQRLIQKISGVEKTAVAARLSESWRNLSRKCSRFPASGRVGGRI